MKLCDRMSEDRPVFERCVDALAVCKSLCVALIAVESRLSLGISVNTTMEIVEFDLRALNGRVDDLMNEVSKVEKDTLVQLSYSR